MKVSRLLIPAFFTGLITLATLVAPTVSKADDITYAVNQSLLPGGITGTITTDGTLGTLGIADVVGWTLTATNGVTSQVFTPSDSVVLGSGTDLTATAGTLSLDFSNENYGWLSFQAISPNLGYASWVAGYVPGAYGYISANVTDDLYLESIQYESGSQIIATDTPEPSTSGLMLIGLVILGLVMRKRIAQTFPQAS
jgi:hypothetical protein